ncbi:MAG TPA: cupin domain-containing protein [Gaiellaceae bacterium]
MELDVGQATVLGPGEGERLNERIVVKFERPEVSVNEVSIGPDFEGPGPHFHKEHVDAFYVLEGELEFTNGTETLRAAAGMTVAVPPGIVHGFTNPGPGGARYLNIHAPDAGFIEYLRGAVAGNGVDWDSYDVDEPSGPADAIVAGPGEGERFERGRGVITIAATAPQLTALVFDLQAGWGPVDPHVHERQVDSFYALDGELVVEVEGEVVRVQPGGFAAIPPGVRHGIRPMETATRFLNFHAPDDGFADFIRRT